MKFFLTTLACSAFLATSLSADFGRIEMGAGVWQQSPESSINASSAESKLVNLADGDYKSSEDASSEMYVWLLVKHPIPMIPNIRLEYVSVADEGRTTGKIDGTSVTDALTAIDMQQFDIIPYYNILDNTPWITLDVGLDIKAIKSDVSVTGAADSHERLVLPLLYVRTRVEIPATELGLEADAKYVTYDGSTVYDVRAKVDYTLDFLRVIQPAVEIGYRVQKIYIDRDDAVLDFKFSGIYAGLMLRF